MKRLLGQLIAPRVLGAALWSLAVVAILLSAQRALALPAQEDLGIYGRAVAAFQQGGSLYGPGSESAPFTYPPFAGLVLLPLAALPVGALRALWAASTLAAVVALAVVTVQAAGALRLPPDRGRLAVPALVLLLVASLPVQSNLRWGQVGVFLTLAVVADVCLLDGRRGQGVLTGLAAAFKLTPLVFIPLLWLAGRKRAARAAATAAGAATALAFLLAPRDSVAFWTRHLWETARLFSIDWKPNQSLYAMLLRTDLPDGPVRLLWLVGSALVLVVGLLRARRAIAGAQPLLGVAIAGAVSVVVSPISWGHHQLWLVLAAAGAFAAGRAANAGIRLFVVATMLAPLAGAELPGVPAWYSANSRLVLAVALACFLPLPVEKAAASAREGEPASVPALQRYGQPERL